METIENHLNDRAKSEAIATSESNSSHSSQESTQKQRWTFWTVFSSTFLTIFLAEMGDKTQLVTLLMSAESRSPWLVFAGSAAALISTSLLGVAIGYWLSKKLSPKTLDLAVAILLLFISALLIGDVIK
jgi:putative Ca2+/H+ antiporter (TMEM165/GDT1 family)